MQSDNTIVITIVCLLHLTAPVPLNVTASAPGSLTVEFTPGPEPNDVDHYEVHSGPLNCSVKANVDPPICIITGLSEGKRHQLNAKACLANGVCSEQVNVTAETLPAGKYELSGLLSVEYPSNCILTLAVSTNKAVRRGFNGIWL